MQVRFYRPLAIGLAVSLGLVFPGVAYADRSEAERRIEAEAIFAQASDLLTAKNYAEACPKLEEVIKLQPQGVGAKIKLAECYEGAGKLASAHAMLEEAASLASAASQLDRASAASDAAKVLEARLSKVTIVVAPKTAGITGLSISRDGSPLSTSLFNIPVSVDGGPHVIRATAPGFKTFEQTIQIAKEGAKSSLEVTLTPADSGPPAGPSGDTAIPSPVADSGSTAGGGGETKSSGGMSGVRIGGIVVGSVGLVVGAIGIGVGVSGINKATNASNAYTLALRNHEAAGAAKDKAAYNSGTSQDAAGWVVTGIGGAALVTGIIMIAAGSNSTSPSPPPTTGAAQLKLDPWAGPSGAGATFHCLW